MLKDFLSFLITQKKREQGVLKIHSLSQVVFGRINCIRKGFRNIYIYLFYLRKLSRLRGQFCSTALVIDTFYIKYCSVLLLTHYYKINLLIEITFFRKKNIYLQIFVCNFMRPKTWDNDFSKEKINKSCLLYRLYIITAAFLNPLTANIKKTQKLSHHRYKITKIILVLSNWKSFQHGDSNISLLLLK